MTLVAIMTVRVEAIDAFHAYEAEAARVMALHGGAIERSVMIPAAEGEPVFKEVHVVTFPNAAALEAYRNDPRLAAIASLREESVIATEILRGHDGPRYGAAREAP